MHQHCQTARQKCIWKPASGEEAKNKQKTQKHNMQNPVAQSDYVFPLFSYLIISREKLLSAIKTFNNFPCKLNNLELMLGNGVLNCAHSFCNVRYGGDKVFKF